MNILCGHFEFNRLILIFNNFFLKTISLMVWNSLTLSQNDITIFLKTINKNI